MYQPARQLLLTLTATLMVTLGPASSAFGQALAIVPPADVGLSTERLQRLEGVLRDNIEQGNLAGTVTLIARHGKIAHLSAAGQQDREMGEAMSPDTIFRIASMTKPVTSAAALILFEEGRFLLDDPVAKYLPALQKMQRFDGVDAEGALVTVAAQKPITIRDLLRHTSGFSYGFMSRGAIADAYRQSGHRAPHLDAAGFAASVADLPLLFEPGSRWSYGISTDVLGSLIAAVSGQSLAEFLEQRLFQPLAMNDTGFYVTAAKQHRLATHYAVGEKGLTAAPTFRKFDRQPNAPSGGGGLVSTATDYARFLQMVLNGGQLDGTRILGRKTVELMLADHLHGLPGMGPGTSFGLGFSLRTALGHSPVPGSVGTASWGGIYNTFFWIDPEEQMIGIFMTQTSPFGHGDWSDRFRVLAYQAIAD